MKQVVWMLAVLLLAGCEKPEPRARSVAELAADPVVLQGVVARCAEDRLAAARDPECGNARLAMERLAAEQATAQRDRKVQEFERLREERRRREEAERLARERAEPKFDPYSSPVMTDPPPAQP